MDYLKLFYGTSLFVLVHITIWFSVNLQFFKEEWKEKSLWIAIALAIPATLASYYAVRFTYEALNNSVWSARFIGFGCSWLVFPFLTWIMLGESMLTSKTMACAFLAFLIMYIQISWR